MARGLETVNPELEFRKNNKNYHRNKYMNG